MKQIVISLAIGSSLIALLVATGKGEFSADTFTLDPRDADVTPFSAPANATNR